jgi:hypothetical protein
MSELDSITDYFMEQQNRASCFSPFHTPEFVTPELDINIDINNFLAWLEAEKRDTDFDADKDYAHNVGSMCEFSCLYISMLFRDTELKGDLKVVYGQYGWWEHYWMSYTFEGVEYFLDLTLQQFVKESPKFSISLAKQNAHGYNFDEEYEHQDFREYLEDKRGFMFYANPHEL